MNEHIRHRVTRVDVAVDYETARANVELLGIRARAGRFEIECTGTDRFPRTTLTAKVGAAKSERHFRLYEHPHDAARGQPTWTRLEAQLRPRAQTTLRELADLADPFDAVQVCVLRESALNYPFGRVLSDLGRFGWLYVRDRLGSARYREFLESAPSLDELELPGPSEVFAAGWRAVVDGLLKSLPLDEPDKETNDVHPVGVCCAGGLDRQGKTQS
jgi:hypothetical protein